MLASDIPVLRARYAARHDQRARYWDAALPRIATGGLIPRVVHQTYPTRELPEVLRAGIDQSIAENPDWAFRLYSAQDRETYIEREYGAEVLAVYQLIRPEYGAARADLFRYLLIYREGGAYLDIKSRFTRPISAAIRNDEGFIVAQWDNAPGAVHEGIGLLPDLSDIAGGEYQQWHVIAAPGHPFLRAVLVQVLANIECYSPWVMNVGRIGVVRLTGPIVYTRAIHAILRDHPHRFLRGTETDMLQYSAYDRSQLFTSKHYSQLTIPIVRRDRRSWVSAALFRVALRAKALLRT
jgi:mannosyltransferase OCH1-like enzyme